MGKKQTEYQRGREDGLDLALRIVKEGGLKALEDEMRFRGISGIHTGMMLKELDASTELIKGITMDMLTIAYISILHDTFGFGEIRINRFIREINKISAYIDRGWLFWTDMVEDIKNRLKIDMSPRYLSREHVGSDYAHPEPEDIYEEADLIDKDLWRKKLLRLNYTEKPDEKRKAKMWIYDEHGDPILNYEGIYNQIQVYDVLSGIEIAKDHYDIT